MSMKKTKLSSTECQTEASGETDHLPRTRAAAKATGARQYFTGKPCPKGHVSARSVSNGGCVECGKIARRVWVEKNPEKMASARAVWEENNREYSAEIKRSYARKFYHENTELAKERAAAWREAHGDEWRKRRREKRANNLEQSRLEDAEWRAANTDKVRATQSKHYAKRRLRPDSRLNAAVAAGIRHSLGDGKKNGRKWESLVGYTVGELKAHLEALFSPGMTWDNYGRNGWEIDHKIPLSAHHFETQDDIDFIKAWALSNLQPLWASDNRSKNAKLDKPFQPSLALAIPANDNTTTDATDVA